MGETPISWMNDGYRDETFVAIEDEEVLLPLFVEDPYARNAGIINDGEGGDTVPKLVQPKRNAPMPAQYLSRVYAESVKSSHCGNVIDHISCFRSEKRLKKDLFEMDK